MKLKRVSWDQYRAGMPNRDAKKTIDDEEYELELVPALRAIRARHRVLGVTFLFDQTDATMEEFEERAPVVPVAPEASGSARTVKSSKR